MSTQVTVNSVPKTRVSINNQQKDTIRTVGVAGAGASNLRDLLDVDATSLDNNETVVYDSATDKFVVKVLPVIDGGTF